MKYHQKVRTGMKINKTKKRKIKIKIKNQEIKKKDLRKIICSSTEPKQLSNKQSQKFANIRSTYSTLSACTVLLALSLTRKTFPKLPDMQKK